MKSRKLRAEPINSPRPDDAPDRDADIHRVANRIQDLLIDIAKQILEG